MRAPPEPENEHDRLEALRRYDILDTPSEEIFDRIGRLARLVAETPMAFVTFIDAHRQWFKTCIGVDVAETSREISFCGHTILRDEPLVIRDAAEHPDFADNPLVRGPPFIRFYLGVPLHAQTGERLGSLCVLDRVPRDLDQATQAGLQDLAALVEHELELRRSAHTDPLTGAFNRRLMFKILAQEKARMARAGGRLTLAYIDIDHFKTLNDSHGHDAGDAVLVRLSQIVSANMRDTDTLFRIGGEEFAVLLVDVAPETAHNVADRIREAVALTAVDHDGARLSVTVSVGLASLPAERDEVVDDLLAQADAALYAAKGAGRNRVEVIGMDDADGV